jgi:hypothetical protein
MKNAPDWLTQPRVEKVTDHIKLHLSWVPRDVPVTFYYTAADYSKAQNLGPQSMAVTKYDGGKASIHLGPLVTDKNFDETFGHELVHVEVFQKYKGAIPKWLEEGLANYFSSKEKVDYKWLAKQKPVDDVHNLAHPFSGDAAQINYRYKASQAFAEMLAKKCDLEVLIGLASEAHKMEQYMNTYCEIKDLNVAFREWVKKKSM